MKYLTYLTACLLVLIRSCQKEYTFTEASQNPTQAVDSLYISRYIVMDTTRASDDTSSVSEFYYDQLKRNTKIVDKEYAFGIAEGIYVHKFFYNGNDTLPYKYTWETATFPNNPPDSRDTTFCTFFNGKLVYDSTISIFQQTVPVIRNYTTVRRISYFANRISIITAVTTNFIGSQNPQTITDTKNYYMQVQNGNVIRQTDTSFSVITDIALSYDTKPNPFRRTQSWLAFGEYPAYSVESGELENFGFNNLVETVGKSTGSTDVHMRYQNYYNSNGTLKLIYAKDLNNSRYFYKGILQYIKL
jgi:hypothetical protein